MRSASLNACLDHWTYQDTFATLDGVPVKTWSERSEMYEIGPLPAENILGAAEDATGVSMADGIYGALALTPGEHVLHFGGEYVFDGGPTGYDLDITYNLTVVT